VTETDNIITVLEKRVLRRTFECKNQKIRNLIIRDQIINELGVISSVGWGGRGMKYCKGQHEFEDINL
jgi:hypothetical protein